MYSYEDRIRAVELYIKLGKRVRPALRQLGYPTKNALKGWYRDMSNGSICRQAMRAGLSNTRRRRRRWLLSTTSLTIDVLPPP